MKLRPASLRQFADRNVFDACEDACLVDSVLDEAAILRSQHHSYSLKDGVKNVILDKSAPDYEQMFLEKGQPLAADEVLESLKPLVLKIPLKARSEFRSGQLPLSELLMAIQYYASHTEMRNYSMDESALITLGLLAEQWADEIVDDNTASMFLELDNGEDLSGDSLLLRKFGPISDSENETIMANWAKEESDSDVMSIDFEESETDEEIQEINSVEPRVTDAGMGPKRRGDISEGLRKKSRLADSAHSSDQSSDSSNESTSESSNESSSESSIESSSESSSDSSTQSSDDTSNSKSNDSSDDENTDS
ncbi:CIC11C00000005075 [Sungouiella intermedia]|uniref:CIC11C00000005075 n=1 Tax=Sungouiella intermedia TaxID=45354 RepID=A0A1L0DI24_9ASCO|nr:CIC11C00000005075 [[Candida] intermedia]